jgi:tetratricopeptide (TPR) repeat protein
VFLGKLLTWMSDWIYDEILIREMMLNTKKTKRVRGVQASPVKLRAALNNSKFKSQNEVAKKIQELESLEKLPRSLVNRVFNGETVDPISVERLAKALEVNAWDLYLDSSETITSDILEPSIPTESISEIHFSRRRQFKKILMIISFSFLLFVSAYSFMVFSFNEERPAESNTNTISIDLARKVVAFIPFVGASSNKLSAQFETAIAQQSSYIAGSSNRFKNGPSPMEIISAGHAELVFSGESQQIGKLLAIRIFMHEGHSMQTIWTGYISNWVSDSYLTSKFAQVLDSLKYFRPASIVPWDSVKQHLEALTYLENVRTEPHLLHMITELSAITRRIPGYANAHASLCNTLVERSLLTGNVALLDDASIACERALELDQDSIPGLMAQASLYRKKGKLQESEVILDRILELEENHVEGSILLAKISVQNFTLTGDRKHIQKAINTLKKADSIELGYWKIPFELGRVYYFNGDILTAIQYTEKAAKFFESSLITSNLGTLQFCAGELGAAKDSYELALTLDADMNGIESNLATVYYFLEDYKKALNIYQKQLESLRDRPIDKRFQIYITIADTHRRLGNVEEAINNYQIALDFLNQQIAKGQASSLQKASRIASYLHLIGLDKSYYSETLIDSIRSELTLLEGLPDPSTIFNVALSLDLLGQTEKAKVLKEKLAGICPGYVASPDFSF